MKVLMISLIFLVTFLGLSIGKSKFKVPQEETDARFWKNVAKLSLRKVLRKKQNTNVARNVILFIGDGMSIATVTASRIFKGQLNGTTGESGNLHFETFPDVGLVKTYNVNRQVSESASTATALMCGVKTNHFTVGVDANTIYNDCQSVKGNEVDSILMWAQKAGKSSGFVTTTKITHSTPAAAYAHTASRDWEADYKVPLYAANCKDIARQLIEDLPGRNLKVMFGGGRKYFLSDADGKRKDNRNLIKEWLEEKRKRKATAKYIVSRKDLISLSPDTDYALGLFARSHMKYSAESRKSDEPSLAEMTRKAIEILQKNKKGYVLLVEGGRIDMGHHEGRPRIALEETLAMDEAVKVALDRTNRKHTLIVVTADHSHTMTISGYPKRKHSIFDFGGISDVDQLPYTSLSYANGRGYAYTKDKKRYDLTDVNAESRHFRPIAAVPLKSETHEGQDVAVYASGPMSHLFNGVVEQNYIAHAMAYAACIGKNKGHCPELKEDDKAQGNSLDGNIEYKKLDRKRNRIIVPLRKEKKEKWRRNEISMMKNKTVDESTKDSDEEADGEEQHDEVKMTVRGKGRNVTEPFVSLKCILIFVFLLINFIA